MSREQEVDTTLACVRKRAEEEEGYRWLQSVLVQEEVDKLGELISKLVLPNSRGNQVLMLAHGLPWAGYFGHPKTHACLTYYFTWSGMRREIAEHCRPSKGCQLASTDRSLRALLWI